MGTGSVDTITACGARGKVQLEHVRGIKIEKVQLDDVLNDKPLLRIVLSVKG